MKISEFFSFVGVYLFAFVRKRIQDVFFADGEIVFSRRGKARNFKPVTKPDQLVDLSKAGLSRLIAP